MTDLPQTIARLREQIRDYLSCGGLFNPESMEHSKVHDLLMDCRDALESRAPAPVVVDAPLIAAARAVINRWDTPLWKDVGPTADCINALRRCLAKHEKGEK